MNRPAQQFRIIGSSVTKLDAAEKVTGGACFGSDVVIPRLLVGKILRSPHAHAIIKHIDLNDAIRLAGVKAIITGSDFPRLRHNGSGGVTQHDEFLSQEVMAREKVYFHGQAVAAVAAISQAAAEDALASIRVEYDVLPHVIDVHDAIQPNAPLLHDQLYTKYGDGKATTPSNIAEHLVMQRGDVESGFAQADIVFERSFKTQGVHQGYLEPDCEAAEFKPDGSLVVWANTQTTFHQRHDLSVVLDMPLHKIRVIPTEVGGAFGGKESVRLSAVCALLSQKTAQPVRITLSREEVLQATGPGGPTVSTIKIGAKRDGTLSAIQARILYDAGAFPGAPLRSAIRRVFSHYRTPHLKIDAYDVLTNKPHVAAYRAPGATPTNFALESVIDEIGQSLGLDPIDFRLKNVSRAGDPMPDGVILPSISLVNLLEQVRQHACWTTPLSQPNQGRGIALGVWTMPGGTTSCHIILNPDASVTLVLGTVDLSATRTSLAMVTAETLGLDLSDVRVVIGDTDTVAFSDPSAGDRITYITSKAILQAAQDLQNRLQARVAETFNVPPSQIVYRNKRFSVQGAPEKVLTLAELAARSVQGDATVQGFGSAAETFSTVAIAPNAAAHIVDVEVDRETGQVQILNYTAWQDVGTCVNPDQVQGQIQGGATQGIGWALSEICDVDQHGAMRNANLLDYRMMTSLDLPPIGAAIVEIPSDDHPLGIRSVGQVPIVPPAAALANAIARATGVRISELPMTPERIYLALKTSAH
ncbi:MAG: xanthine dehydrogenase family protein molybdopterin-binding subunit [bacterium]|nr:xanthine dehydrogenase family protein molybdopterin-binding subunit [bacterium]